MYGVRYGFNFKCFSQFFFAIDYVIFLKPFLRVQFCSSNLRCHLYQMLNIHICWDVRVNFLFCANICLLPQDSSPFPLLSADQWLSLDTYTLCTLGGRKHVTCWNHCKAWLIQFSVIWWICLEWIMRAFCLFLTIHERLEIGDKLLTLEHSSTTEVSTSWQEFLGSILIFCWKVFLEVYKQREPIRDEVKILVLSLINVWERVTRPGMKHWSVRIVLSCEAGECTLGHTPQEINSIHLSLT